MTDQVPVPSAPPVVMNDDAPTLAKAFDVNLLGDETVTQKANQLYYISKESLKRRQIDELWKAKRATAPKSLANVVLSPAVAESIRKELRRTTG